MELSEAEARACVLGLVMDCPFEPNPTECALYEVRQKTRKERVKWVQQLTEGQVIQTIRVHKECLAKKEGKATREVDKR